MRIRSALRILVDNFGNTYKQLLYRLITGALFIGISYVILSLGLRSITASAELADLEALLKNFVKAIISGNISYLESFQETFFEAVKNFGVLLVNNIGSIVGSVIGVVVVYLLSRFLNGVSIFAMGTILNDKMAFYSKTSFSTAYFKNIGQAMLYQIIYVPLAFVYDALALLACWFFFLFTPSLFSFSGTVTVLLGLSLSLAAFICLEALKMTVISSWIPAVVTGKSVTEAFRGCFQNSGKNFAARFSNYLILIYLIAVVNVICALFTLGSFLLITVPASFLLILCLQLVHYYEDNNMKYFVTLHDISGETPKDEIDSVMTDKSDNK